MKGNPKLTVSQKKEIISKHQSGSSLRELAEDYKCSHERIRQIVRFETDDYIPNLAARKFRDKHTPEFLKLVAAGVTPEIAAGTLGLNREGLDILLSCDADFAMAVEAARMSNLAEAEQTIATEAKTNWKAALERLTRAKETRDHWKSGDNNKGGNQINIIMDWSRTPTTIDHEE